MHFRVSPQTSLDEKEERKMPSIGYRILAASAVGLAAPAVTQCCPAIEDSCFPFYRWNALDRSVFVTFLMLALYLIPAAVRRLFTLRSAEKHSCLLRPSLDAVLDRFNFEEALAVCKRHTLSPVAAVAAGMLEELKAARKPCWLELERIKQAGRRAASIEIAKLERKLDGLKTAAVLVLLLGFLCAAWDMGNALDFLRFVEWAGLSAISGYVSHALWSVSAASALSMLAYGFDRYLLKKIRSISLQIEQVQIDVLWAYVAPRKRLLADSKEMHSRTKQADPEYLPESWMRAGDDQVAHIPT
jgi:biopolymer transport protein ExbB/TolQ